MNQMPHQQAQIQLLPLDKLIRPEQVGNLTFLSPEDRTKYHAGITNLWKKMQEQPPGQERLQFHQRLSEVTHRLRQQVQKWRQSTGQMAQPNAPQPHPQAQMEMAAMQMARGDVQQPQPQAPPPPQQQQAEFSQRVRNEARSLPVAIPMSLRTRSTEEQQQWANGQRLKYARILQSYENAERQMKELQQRATQRHATNPLSPEEKHNVTQQLQQLKMTSQDAQKAAVTLKQQHEQARQQQQYASAQQHAANQVAMAGSAAPPNQNVPPRLSIDASGQDVMKPDDSKGVMPKDDNPPTSASGITQGGDAQQPPNNTQLQNPLPPSGAPAEVTVKPEPNVSSQGSPPATQAGPTKPLSHQDAINRASQHHPQAGSQPAHGHPAQAPGPAPQREQPSAATTLTQRPQNRPLNVAPPTAVTMPSARPTLSGGSGTAGPMGQPAIQKHPGYVLEGEGERVLSKKKLEELVRQVTGGSNGEDGETLDPDVEEILLDVADEFVDNVIVAACRLAKLRQNPQLELRDIQLILERNYNIRVPGYASDELRTVKRIQPTQAWAQKMSAVQAAKVTGGKADS